MKDRELNKDEKSLLMFFEDMAVNQFGWIDDMKKMNEVDMEIAKKWDSENFVLFQRASKSVGETILLTYVVRLSEEAWSIAHKLRKEKSLRHIPEMLQDYEL